MAATNWWRGAVLYQIYPRSFMDSNGDGIGDLKGIASKLDHVKSLGVDGIWLSPFFKSPMRDFGYDVSDYRAVDPMFGTMQDFEALLKAAHDRDLKVIIDQVWSHTSSDHEWFQQSRQDGQNEKSDWYVWADPKPDGSPPNNWQAWFGGPAWTWEPRRRQYFLHNFLPTQPDLNFRSDAVRVAILDVARFWLQMGVDGFRLDVANYYVHDAALRDNPPSGVQAPALPRDMQLHQYNSNQPETLDFIAKIRERVDGLGDNMTVGELAPGSYALMADYTRGQRRLHTAYSFDFLAAWPGVDKMGDILSQWRDGPDDGWPSWAFSNHDVKRVATRWGEALGCPPPRAAPLFMALLLSLRGTIFLYQGEELGLPEADVPFEKLQDPWGINGWPATKGRDGCRTPMPWKDESLGGFSKSKDTWLPMDARQRTLAVDTQEKLAESMLHTTRTLIALRKRNAALNAGAFRVVHAADDLLVFDRELNGERIQCVFNFSASETSRAYEAKCEVLWTSDPVFNGATLVIPPFSGCDPQASVAFARLRTFTSAGQAARVSPMIRVQTEAFDPHAETAAFAKGRGEAGALASFIGTVRDSAHANEDGEGAVAALELEGYPGFTEKQIAKIESDARMRFDVMDTLVIHRYGRMAPGEAIVLVAALSKHRREALQAVDYLMDRLKTEAPFWKKEVRAAKSGDEHSEWIEPRADDREAHARWTSDTPTKE